MQFKTVGLLVFCVAGIYGSYLTQGLVSEHLSTKRYGAEQHRFPGLVAVNGLQAVVCFIWAWVLLGLGVASGRVSGKDMPSWTAYWKAAVTNCIGPACGMIALRNISYSAQVLAKSCKMVPVMIAGSIISKKRYSGLEYACMMLIGVGVALFAQKQSGKVTNKLADPNAPVGYLLCFINLAFDGYTNAAQDEINQVHPKNHPLHMMTWMNFWTGSYYLIYLFAVTDQGQVLLNFCMQHPDAAQDILLFCICGAVGQLFIFFTIKTFGSLVNTLICTTRKFFNILISVVINVNPLLPVQWVAVSMVFCGLITSSLTKKKHHQHQKKD